MVTGLFACDADAPLKVINYLAEATHHDNEEVTNWGGTILMHQRNRSIDVVRSYFGKWNWPWCKYMYCDHKKDENIERAYYCLHRNDCKLVHVSISWPLPSNGALEAVVKAISYNSTVVRLDIGDKDMDLLPFHNLKNIPVWWNGKEEKIKELLSFALARTTV